MTMIDVLQQGVRFANSDPAAQEMLADFKDHKVGMKLDKDETTIVIKDGTVMLESRHARGLPCGHAMTDIDLCGAIDNSYDLMEIREKGEIIKGDKTDPNTAVHFMALFPFFDAMVRLYEQDQEFKNAVDAVKAAL